MTQALQDPVQVHKEVLPFLPMIYVAWSDGVLTPTEVQTICSHIDAQPWLGDTAKSLLTEWLNPASPPEARVMRGWINAVQEGAAAIPDAKRRSLAELGLEMARVSANIEIPKDNLTNAANALLEIEAALGVVGHEAVRELLSASFGMGKVPPTAAATASFAPADMCRLLDGDGHEAYQQVRTLLCDPVFRYPDAIQKDEHRERVLGWCKALADQGLGLLQFPKVYGGSDEMAKFLVAFETIAYHDLSLLVKYGVQFGLWGGSVLMLGTERHHKAYLKDIGTLDLPGCFAMTELGHGSDVRSLETIARYDHSEGVFVLHTPTESARKEYIGNAACHGRAASVFAQLEVNGEQHGVHAFVVPIRNADGTPCEGVKIADCGEKMGLNGVDNGRLWFDQVKVPRENLLNRFGDVTESGEYHSDIASEGKRFFSMLGTLVGGRVSVGAASLSVSKSSLAIAIKYGSKRRQFGPAGGPETPLLDYLSHQRRLMPLLARSYALNFAFRHLQREYLARTEETIQGVELLAAGLKSYASWHATETAQVCRECCGGQGYMAVNRFRELKADSDVFTTFEGDNTVLMQLVTKGLISNLRREFSDMKFFGLVRFIANQAARAISERNPVIVRNTDPDHLSDPAFHLEILQSREQDLLVSLSRRLKRRIDEGVDSFDAFLEVQDHVLSLAHAHIEYEVMRHFQEGITACSEPTLLPTLQQLSSLYALDCVTRDMSWFLENDYIENSKARAIRKTHNELCVSLRTDALALVDAFGIPDEVLAAPIAID